MERLGLVRLQFYDIVHSKDFDEERSPLRRLYKLDVFLGTDIGNLGHVEYCIKPSKESESHKGIVWLTNAESLAARMTYAAVERVR